MVEWPGCCICSDTDSLTDTTQLPCGHIFHSHCLAKWLWQNTSCPICRAQPDVSQTSPPPLLIDDDNESCISTEKSLSYHQAARRSCVRKSKKMTLKIESIKRLNEKLQTMRGNLKSIDQAIHAIWKSANERKRKQRRLYDGKLRLIQYTLKQDTLHLSQQRKRTLRYIYDTQRSVSKHKENIVQYVCENV